MIDLTLSMKCKQCSNDLGSNPIACETCMKILNWTRLLTIPPDWYKENTPDNLDKLHPYIIKTQKDFLTEVHEMNEPDILYKYWKMLEAACIGAKVLYQAKIVKERIVDPKSAEKSNDFKAAIKDQKKSNLPKKERKLLSDFDKAVESYVKIMPNMKREDIEKMVHESMNKQGRTIGDLEFSKK